jgi:putative flippase GtrA
MKLGLSVFVGCVLGVFGGVALGMAVEWLFHHFDVQWVGLISLQALILAGLCVAFFLRWLTSDHWTMAGEARGVDPERAGSKNT